MKRQKFPGLVKFVILGITVAVISLTAAASWAQDKKYPTRPIQVIVGYNPGSTDTYIRVFTEYLPKYLGQPISFVYKPGAAGSVGASFVAKSKPDGYTLFGCSTAPVILGPVTKEGMDFTLESFAPIVRYVMTPMGVAVKSTSPIKTLKDLVEAAKSSPGKLTYSTSGSLGSPHFGMEMFSKEAKIKMTQVPCQGDAISATSLLGGHVDMAASSLGPLKPHIDSGAFRMLGVMQKNRMKYLPDIPTFTEAGYPVVFPLWYGLMAPKGVPKEVVEAIYQASKKALEENRAAIEDKLKQIGPELSFLGPEEMGKENKAHRDSIQIIFKEIKKNL